MADAALRLEPVAGDYVVCRLPAGAAPPPDPGRGALFSATRTADEVSVVCPADAAPAGARTEGPFAALRVSGALDFSLTGILASLAAPLAEAGVSVFAISTFDTDYLLVPRERLDDAREALAAAGHELVGSSR
ncbi:MAG TPA: ACT domain-containing protein [Solirubrobacterales bacterium]|nr:ACT domain-containing protein [Solirubrobacterales bacterium]